MAMKLLLLVALFAVGSLANEAATNGARKLLQTTCNPAGNVCQTNNGNGTTTTCVTAADGYHYCNTHANGSPTPTPRPTTGRKLQQATPVPTTTTAPPQCDYYPGGSTCRTTYSDGTASVCVKNQYVNRCSRFPSGGDAGRKLMNAEGLVSRRQLKAYTGCDSGSWGSTCTKDNGNGTSTVCTTTPYSHNCSTFKNAD